MTHSKKRLLSPLSNKIRLLAVVAILSILGSATSLTLITRSPSYSPYVLFTITEATYSYSYSGWLSWVAVLTTIWLVLTLIESIFVIKTAKLLWLPETREAGIVGRINTALDYVRSGTPWIGLQSVISVLTAPVLVLLSFSFRLSGLGFVGLIALACSILGLLVWSWFREIILARSHIGEIMSSIH